MKAENFFKSRIVVVIGALICAALWGSATPFIKIGYELMLPQRDVQSTILFAGIRFLCAGIITVVLYSLARRKMLIPKKGNWARIGLVGCFQTVIQYIFFYIGLANTSGVKGTILSGTNAFFSLLIASLIFKQEKLTAKKLVACVIGFAGLILINLNGLEFTMNFYGDTFVIFSTIAYAFSSVLIKKFSKYEDPVVISGYQFVMGGLFMIVVGLLFGGNIEVTSYKAVGVLMYLAFLSATAYALWGVLLKYNPVSKVSIFNFMTPVFGVILSEIMLTEASKVKPVNVVVTLVLISIGIFMLNHKNEKGKI